MMANKVKNIHESLKRIHDEANQYGLIKAGPLNASPEMIPNREIDSSLDHLEVVGRENHVSEIVELLLNAPNQQLSVIPIVGMTGLGKTTLANELEGKKYILVLDGVWNEDPVKWETLRSCLLDLNLNVGNSIIVTTRSEKVAEIMETLPRCYLEKLFEDDCWSIIMKNLSLNEKIPPTLDLKAIGRENNSVHHITCAPHKD